ncbi:hypothetical protein F8M41_024663 [Gigaspora margarita]|uniref:Uncharacterized protein n=1 Tax=Gigaspora margarita TaxID=4874 RepID=A0A8H3XJS8_GIGMA|nr:hypothetical protein F8M41_024663 [Gigaspora margarita]
MVRLTNQYVLKCKSSSALNVSSIKSPTEICVCDFRLNIRGCAEENLLVTINLSQFVYSTFITITTILIFYYFIKIKNYSFLISKHKNCKFFYKIRSFYVIEGSILIFNFFRATHSLCLLMGVYSNTAEAEILSGIICAFYPLSILNANPIGNDAFALIVFTIRRTINKKLVVYTVISLSTLLLVTILPLSFLCGYYADIGKVDKAVMLFMIRYLVWSVCTFFILFLILCIWYKYLMIIIDSIQQEKRYNFNDEDLNFKLDRLKSGAGNLSRSMFIIMLVAIFYSTLCICYGLFHKTETIFIHPINMMYVLVWNVAIPVFLHICQIIYTFYSLKALSRRSNFGYGVSGNLVIPLVTSPIAPNFEIIQNENDPPYCINSVYEENDRKFLSNKNSINNVKNIERIREYQNNQIIGSSSFKISYTKSSNSSLSICKESESSKERSVNKDWLIEAPKKVLIQK